ncbi:MAG: FAD-dependent monooxygenase [Bacteroidota bacterium]
MSYAIIGAGIGGLTTAQAFEQKGIPYQVFEKAPFLKEVGAGIWLAPNALQVLERLGVLKEVQRQGNAIVQQSWSTGKMAHWKYGRGLRNWLMRMMPKRLMEKKMMDMYRIEEG